MLRTPSLIALILALTVPQIAFCAPKVAVMYSAWSGGAFKDEFDPHLKAFGWTCEKFENRDIAKLAGRLGEFDVVISTSVGNLENAQDMAPYKEAWLGFLNRGGVLLIPDASYDSVLGMWMGKLGPDWALTSAGCAPYTKKNGGSDAIVCDKNAPLLHVPHELPPLFRAKAGIWAHIDSWGAGWKSLITCADGKSLFVTRDVGKGCVAVTSYFSFKGDASQALVTGLLDNLWTHALSLRTGLSIDTFDPGEPALGKRNATVTLHNVSDQPSAYTISITTACGQSAPTPGPQVKATVQPGAKQTMSLPYVIDQRGEVRLSLTVAANDTTVATLDRQLTVPPMVALKIKNRHLYPPGGELAFSAAFVPDAGVSLASCTGELLVDGQRALRLLPLKAEGDYVADVSKLPVGQHRVALRLSRQGKSLGAVETDFYRHAVPKVYSRPDGTTMIEGKPFFPFGWYHVSWGYSADDRLAFLRDIAAGGFNAVHASIKTIDEWEPFLNEADKLGVKVVTEFGVDPVQVITRYKDKPAVLAWNPGDEPDGGGISPDEMLRRYDSFKIADPDHPTYMTLCVPPTYRRYVGCAEIIAPDPYPVYTQNASTMPVYNLLSSARAEAAKYGRPVWGVLQCFGYEKGPWRIPTFAECRNMTYLALLSGVKGIIYYTYADNGFLIPKNPDLWAQMKTLPPEIKALEPALLDGHLVKLETGRDDVVAGAWTVGNRVVVCVANTSDKESRQVALTLPLGAKGAARPVFDGRPSGMTANAGKLSGEVKPLDVHVYEFGG